MSEKEKALVGEKAAESFVKNGMIVGIGTGSTVYYTIVKLGEMIKNGLSIEGVATSRSTELLAEQHGIPLLSIEDVERIDVAIDGADEIDGDFYAIKGGGGALFREKVIATLANQFVVVADSTKVVNQLGRFPLPVEVVPFGANITEKYLQELGCTTVLRERDGRIFISDNGNYIIDCHFEVIENPNQLATKLNNIVGVVENGLFLQMVDQVVTMNSHNEVIINHAKI